MHERVPAIMSTTKRSIAASLFALVAIKFNVCVAQTQYYMGGGFGGNTQMPAANPTSQQYIIYNRETPQTQQPVYHKIVDPGQNMNVQNVRQQQYWHGVNQPQNHQDQQPGQQQKQQQNRQHQQQLQQQQQQQQQQLSHKLFHVSNVSNQQQQQLLLQHLPFQPITKNNNNNNNGNNIQLIANGNSLSTLSSSGTIPQSSTSFPSSSAYETNPFQPLLPVDIIEDIREGAMPSPSQPGQCQNCCVPNQLPCSSCCDSSPFLNIQTLKSMAG